MKKTQRLELDCAVTISRCKTNTNFETWSQKQRQNHRS